MAFQDCSGLANITVNSDNSIYDSREGCNAIIETSTNTLIAGCKNTIIPNSVTSIGDYAFSRCTGLTSVVIPNSVTSIGRGAFYGCSGLTSIEIPNSVTSIGNSAFNACTKLASVTIGEGVTSIGNSAFNACTNLKTVYNNSSLNIVAGNTGYGYVAYYADKVINARSIEGDFVFGIIDGVNTLLEYIGNGGDVTLPADYKSGNYVIGDRAFYGCSGLTSVTIPNSVTSIGDSAFSGCTGLTSVTIPSSVTSIGDSAFFGCTGLASVTIPNSVTSIGNSAFNACTGLTSITIPNSVISIGELAFYKCSGLTIVTIPNSVTSIGRSAFNACTKLASVTIGEGVTSIGSKAFYGCTNLKTVYNYSSLNIVAGNTDYGYVAYYADKVINVPNGSVEGDFVFGIEDGVNTLCGYLGNGGDVTLPENYNGENYVIGSSVFRDNTAITSVVIPNSVTSIGGSAFYDCDSLTSVTIGNSVTSIGEWAFADCSGLTSVTIGYSVTSIGYHAFYSCSGLKTVYNHSLLNISKGSTGNGYVAYYADKVINAPNGSIEGDFVFGIKDGVKTLCGYIGNGGDVTLPADYNGENYVIGDSVFYKNTAITSVTIGNSVTSIGDNAFSGCSGLTSVTIPNSVTSIGNSAFNGCDGLTSVTIGNSVTSIGNSAFNACTGLTSIEISNSVTSIGSYAFYNCTGLTSVTIGNSVTSIGESAFYGCHGLTAVYINDLAAWCRIDFSNFSSNPLSYAHNLYLNGEKVTDLVIPSDITEIKKYAFSGCSGLTGVEIPNSVTSIGFHAFEGCTGLTSVEIPNSVTSIGEGAFLGCSGLTSIEIPNSVTSIGEWAFSDCNVLTAVYINDLAAWCRIDFGSNSLSYAHNLYLNGEKVTNLVIPSDITEIKQYAFYLCSGLTSVVIPNSVTSIGGLAFNRCTGLKTVYNCSSLNIVAGSFDNGCVAYYADKVINAPNGSVEGDFIFGVVDGVNTLCGYVGNGGDITLPENYNGASYAIGADAFKDNTAITGVTIPAGVTAIGDNAFYDCENLKTVYNNSSLNIVAGSTDNGYVAYYADKVINADGSTSIIGGYKFTSANGVNTLVEYLGDGGDITLPENYNGENYVIGNSVFQDNIAIKSVTIPNSVTSIGEYAFSDCLGLKILIINSGSIGEYAFAYCRYLTSVTIGDGVTSIGNSAFYRCSGLKSVTIGNSVTSIGDNAFSGCTGLTGVTIGNGVTSIGSYVFNACTGLTSIVIPNSVTSIGNDAFSGCTGLTSVTIGNGVTSIGSYVFQGCSGLTSIEIPNSVTSIGYCAFSGCSGLTGIEIPNSVTSIGNSAFHRCSGLTSITIPNSVTSIGNSAFYGCSGLTSITIPNSVTSIGNSAFYGCSGLTSVTIGNSVTSIGGSAFYGCSGLTSVTIGNSVTSIGEGAFEGCSGLISVTIPNSVKSIGYYAFHRCTGLASVTIGNSVTSIGGSAFWGCENLKTVTNNSSLNIVLGSTDNGYVAYYADNVITINADGSSNGIIGDYKFTSANGVNTLVEYLGDGGDITLPENYNGENYVIGSSVFRDNTAITDVTISAGVTAIGDNAFYGCDGLKTVTNNSSLNIVLGSTDNGYVAYYADKVLLAVHVVYDYKFQTINGVNTLIEYTGDGGDITLPENYNGENYVIGSSVFQDNTAITSVVIPNSATSIGYNAFYECTGLTSVTIGNGVTSIGTQAFSGCSGLTSIEIPNSVTSIGELAFYRCSRLASVTIGSGVTSIGDDAFRDCTGLTSITIPNSVTSIGESAFSGCSGLTSVTIGNSVTSIKWGAFSGCSGLTSIEIPNSVTSIGGYAFNACTGLTGIEIPNSVTSIDYSAFEDCTGLTSVTIPNSVTSIGFCVFQGCTGLTSIVIPNSVTSIGGYAFNACTGLTSIEIPNSVTSIDYSAFEDCTGLTSVTIPNSVTSIGYNAFYRCTGLTSIVIPNSVTSIGESVFEGCTGLTAVHINDLAAWCRIDFSDDDSNPLSYAHNLYLNGEKVTDLVIPSDITEIKQYAFYNCIYFTRVTIPNSVTSIGYNAFYRCHGLTSIVIPNSVTSIGESVFEDCIRLKTVYNCSLLNIVVGSTDNGYVAYYADEVINIPNGSIEGDFVFGIIDGVNTLVEYTGDGGDIILPENYNGENYVIGANVFQDNTTITGIVIPNSVTSIGGNAFYGCSDLRTVYNHSLLNISKGSTNNGYVAYYANKVINAPNGSIEGDFVFGIIDGVNTLVEYLGNSKEIILDSWTSTNAGVDYSTSENTWTINAQAGDILTFDWRVSSESRYDKLIVTIDGSEILNKSGEDSGNYTHTFENAGTYTLVARYTKDVSTHAGDDCASISNVKIASNGNASIALVLPENYNGENYVIGSSVFYNNTAITEVTIPAGVTAIGDNAFYGCTGLTSVTIGDGVTAIGDNAFYGCTGLTSVTIGDGVTAIGDNAFQGCTGLTGIEIPNSVTSIGGNAFSGCTGLTSVTIPNSVTSIGDNAFYGCSGLTSITVNSDNSIYDSREGCNAIIETATNTLIIGCENTIIPNSVTSIGNDAFYNCTGLTSIEIPNSVTSIGDNAFYDCENLTSVTIGNSVTSIGEWAFAYCSGLTSVTIGYSVTSIGSHAFYGCSGLTAVHINDLAAWCRIDFSSSSSNPLYRAHNLYLNGEKVIDLVIPSDITEIKQYAFSGCTGLTSITIPNSVTSIGDYAFYGCSGLKTVINKSSLNIVAGSTDNGYVAYYADEVITPPSISYTSLPAYFNTDNGLPGTIEGNNHIWESETMYFETPKSGIRITVFDINEGEYYNNVPMVALGELEFYDADGNKINYTASDVTTNSLESKEGSLAGLCDGDYSTFYHSIWSGEGTAPDNYVYVEVQFPQAVDAVSIKIVGRDNKRIVPTSIGITENGEYCEISAPTNGTCGESTTWSYNDGVLTISGSGAVTDKGWNKYINSIIGVVIEEGITSIMDDAFLRYSNLTSATLPGTLAVLPKGVFSRTGLTCVTIPEGVTTLGMWAFDNCPALATVTLPTTLTSISDYAFENCTALASVTSNAVIAPTLGANVFGSIAEGATLTYPQGSDYSSWSDYFTISLFTPGDINGDSEVNVGDFASLVNLIFNSDNIDAATMAVADINSDGEVNVGDFAGLVNLIFNSGSQAAPKRAAALAATVEPSLYIEPFSIAPGEQKQIEVLLDNPGEKFSQLQFDLALPEGIEIVFDEDNFCYTIDRGSRLASVYNIDAQDVSGGVKVLALTTNPKAYIKGESGDVVLITVQAAEDIADGVYDLSINNVVLSHQDGSTVKATSTTAAITVSSTTGLTNIEGAEGSDVYYDLQGRAVKEPSNGFYIVNGKKVFIK